MESITGSDVVVVAFGLQTTNYLYFSMFVLSIYDWLISLDYEVKHIWQSEWNISKILFIITRYGTLLDMPMKVAIFAARYGVVDSDACNILLKATTWLTLLGMSVSELILLLRTIAIYSRSKRVAVPLSIAYVVGVVVGITINWYYFHTTLVGAPLNNGLGGCYIEQKNNRIVLQSSLLLLLAFELAVVIDRQKKVQRSSLRYPTAEGSIPRQLRLLSGVIRFDSFCSSCSCPRTASFQLAHDRFRSSRA